MRAAILAVATIVIVPGHGPVMRDKVYLREIEGLMESIDRAWQQARGKMDPEGLPKG